MTSAEPVETPDRLTFRTPDGLTLVADAWGRPGDPVVLLAHGGGQTRHAWGGTARALARRDWYAVSIDQRGHGESDWAPDGNYSLEAFADDLRAIAATFNSPPAVVGASLGGLATLIAEGKAGGGFAAVVLVDITPHIERGGFKRIVDFMEARAETGFASLEEAADYVAAYLPHRPRPRDLTGLEKNLRLHPDGRYRWHWDPQFLSTRSRREPEHRKERLAAAASTLSVPTLLVRGAMSDLVSEEAARKFLALVPHAAYADVSEAGHMVAGDRNDAFTEAVLDFLRSVRDPGAAGSARQPDMPSPAR